MTRRKGKDGTYSMRMKKEHYYVCEEGYKGTGRLAQTKLSFGTPLNDVKKSEDTSGDVRSIGSKGKEEDISQGQ